MKNPMNSLDRMSQNTIAMIRNNRRTDRIFLVEYHITVNLALSDYIILL
jgi:hypothetical protein